MANDPWADFEVVTPSQKGPTYGPPPKAPAPPSEAEMARVGISEQNAQLARERFEYEKQRDAQKAEKPATAQDQKAAARAANLDSLVNQINRVQDLYNRGLRDEAIPILSSLAEFLPTETNRQFDSAAAGLAEQGMAAFRVPGVGAQSDTELRQFVEANKPSASDYDTQIEEKLLQLRNRVDANRKALGLDPAQWQGMGATQDDEAVAVNEPRRNFAPGPDRYELASGDTRTVQDDSLAAVADEYRQRLVSGQRAGEIIPWLRSQGVSGETLSQVAQQIRHRDNNPGFDPNQYSIDFTKEVPVSTTEKVANAIGGSALGGYVAGAGNFLSGNNIDSLAGLMGGNPDDVNQALGIIQEQSPNAYAVGEITGGVAGALGTEALIGARIASPVLRSLVADGTYGGFVGAGASDYKEDGSSATALDRVAGAGTGGLAGLIGSYAGNKVGGGLAKVGRGVTDASVQAMQDAGVPMTLGQIASRSGKAGEILKAVEDRAMSIPGVGDMIRTRRNEGLDRFNSKAFDMALEPIRETVGNKTGEEAMQAAHEAVSAAYERALAGKVAVADPTFATDLTNAVTRVMSLKRIGGEVADGVEEILQPYMNGNALDGAAMQQISRELRGLKAAYGKDPMASRIGKALDSVEDSVFGLFERQTPEVVPAYEAARKAARRLYTIEDAVLKGKNTEGKFTPAQLGMADRQATSRYGGKRAAATGKGEFHDYQRDAQNVLPSQYPDSGTAGRIAQIALPGAIAGSGAGIGYAAGDPQGGAATGLTLAAVLTGAYSKAGQRVLTKPFRGSKAVQAVSGPRVRRAISATGAASAASLANQQ